MKCRIIQIEDYYQGEILCPVVSHRDGKKINDGFAWQKIYDGEKYGNVATAKVAIEAYIQEVVRKPRVIEEFEL